MSSVNKSQNILSKLKHLRGRHDQRDHAWNRGMGRGGTGSSAASSHPKKAKVSEAEHRADIVALQKKVDAGEMTYHDMQNKLRDNRGYPPLAPRTRKQTVQDGKGLAQAQANVRPLASADVSAQAAGSVLNNEDIAFTQEDIRPLVDIRDFPPPRDLIRSEEPFVFDEESFIKSAGDFSLTDEQQVIFDDMMQKVNEELQNAIKSGRRWARSGIINEVFQNATDYDSPYPRNIRTKPINKFNDLLRQTREQQDAEYKVLNGAIEISRSPDGTKNEVERNADSIISSLKNDLINRYGNLNFGESFFDSISEMSDEQQLALLTDQDSINKFNAAGKYMELVATIAVAGKSEASKKAISIAAANQKAEINSGLSPHPDYNSTLSFIQDNSLQQIQDIIGTVPSTDIFLKITEMSNEKNLNGKLANSILKYISDENTPNDIVRKQKYAELIQEVKNGRDDANGGFYKKNVDLYLSENDPDSVNDRTLLNPAILPSIANAGIVLQQQSMSDPSLSEAPAAMQMLGLDPGNSKDWQLFADLLSIYVSDDRKSYASIGLSPGRIDSLYEAYSPIAGKEITANRSIRINAETKSVDIYNNSFKSVGQSQTGGVGHSMMTRQAAAAQEIAKRLGYSVRAITNAASVVSSGATQTWNGFHTWPKLGYRFPIPSNIQNELMKKYGFTSDELMNTATFFLSQRLINGKTPADAWSDILNSYENESYDVAGEWMLSNPNELGLQILKKYNAQIRAKRNKSTSYGDEFGFSEDDLAIYTDAWNKLANSQKTNIASVKKRLKHLRGRHDQRDHAWNRGMGRGGTGSSAASSHPKKAKVSEAQHRADIVALQKKVDAGEMTYHDMQNKLRDNRGYPPLPPRTRKQKVQDSNALSQARANIRQLSSTDISTQAASSISNNQTTSIDKKVNAEIETMYNDIQSIIDAVALKQKDIKDVQDAIASDDGQNPKIKQRLEEILSRVENTSVLDYASGITRDRYGIINPSILEDYVEEVSEIFAPVIDTTSRPYYQDTLQTIKQTADEARELAAEQFKLNQKFFNWAVISSFEDAPEILKTIQQYHENHMRLSALSNTIASAIEQHIRDVMAKNSLDANDGGLSAEQSQRKNALFALNDSLKEQARFLISEIDELQKERYRELGKTDTEYAADAAAGKIIPLGGDEKSKEIKKVTAEYETNRAKKEKIDNEINDLLDIQDTIRKQIKSKSQLMVDTLTEIFKNLRHPNAIPISIVGDSAGFLQTLDKPNAEYSLSDRENIVNIIMSTTASKHGHKEFEVTFAPYTDSTNRASAGGRRNTGKIHAEASDSPEVIAHEALHLLAEYVPGLQRYLNKWASNRVKNSGEKLRKLSEIYPNSEYEDDEIAVVDSVDDAYTLKAYDSIGTDYRYDYHEVLSMAFTGMFNHGYSPKDRELRRVAIHALLLNTPDLRVKTKSLSDRIMQLKSYAKKTLSVE